MFKKHVHIPVIVVCLAVILLLYGGVKYKENNPSQVPQENTNGDERISQSGRRSAEEFISANISFISPEKEVLGGKFYITEIVWESDLGGMVFYEDGHIALKARFSLMPTTNGFVFESFEIITE